jgi:hypothetical protein
MSVDPAAPRSLITSRAPEVRYGTSATYIRESEWMRAGWIGKSMDYLGWPRRRLHSPRAERRKVTPPSPPSAQSVQTKKKPPVDLAISP